MVLSPFVKNLDQRGWLCDIDEVVVSLVHVGGLKALQEKKLISCHEA